MARVLISKASLADFGVPRQKVAVRQPTPTAEEIERAVRQSDLALTPMQYATKVPLIDREKEAYDEKDYQNSKGYGKRERFDNVAREFNEGMGLEGALATGVAMREFPNINMGDHHEIMPFLRDYYGRQTTLPEYDWDYHTQGPYYDEQGNILPGQVPPVNAVKVMAQDDINEIGKVTGFGLKPTPKGVVNRDWERGVNTQHRFPSDNAGFVGNLSFSDIRSNIPANVAGSREKGIVGIRGFGSAQDKAFARGRVMEGTEGVYTAPIPPERLVGVMPGTNVNSEDFNDLKRLYSPEKGFEQKLQTLVDENIISPMDAVYATIRHRSYEKDREIFSGLGDDSENNNRFFPYPKQIRNTDAGHVVHSTGYINTPEGRKKVRDSHLSPAQQAVEDVGSAYHQNLPMAWEQGVFGLENPILTDEEKLMYIKDIERNVNDPYDATKIDEIDRKNLPSLYPKEAGVRFA